MKNQKAIEILQDKISPCVTDEWKEAVDAAISALQAQDVPDICIVKINSETQKELNALFRKVATTPVQVLPPEHGWIPVSKRLPDKYGEYRITWTTSVSKKPFIGDSEYEVTGEWDDKRGNFKGEWLLDDNIKAYPDVKVIAWKPIEEPYTERREK